MGMLQSIIGTLSGGTENALAAVDVPRNGVITGLDWACRYDFDADLEYAVVELSFGSTYSNTSDSRQVISMNKSQHNFITSGAAQSALNRFVGPLDIAVAAGERIFLNVDASAGVIGDVGCIIHYSFDDPRPAMRR